MIEALHLVLTYLVEAGCIYFAYMLGAAALAEGIAWQLCSRCFLYFWRSCVQANDEKKVYKLLVKRTKP